MTQYKEVKAFWGERITYIPNPPQSMWGDTVKDWAAAASQAFEKIQKPDTLGSME